MTSLLPRCLLANWLGLLLLPRPYRQHNLFLSSESSDCPLTRSHHRWSSPPSGWHTFEVSMPPKWPPMRNSPGLSTSAVRVCIGIAQVDTVMQSLLCNSAQAHGLETSVALVGAVELTGPGFPAVQWLSMMHCKTMCGSCPTRPPGPAVSDGVFQILIVRRACRSGGPVLRGERGVRSLRPSRGAGGGDPNCAASLPGPGPLRAQRWGPSISAGPPGVALP